MLGEEALCITTFLSVPRRTVCDDSTFLFSGIENCQQIPKRLDSVLNFKADKHKSNGICEGH